MENKDNLDDILTSLLDVVERNISGDGGIFLNDAKKEIKEHLERNNIVISKK